MWKLSYRGCDFHKIERRVILALCSDDLTAIKPCGFSVHRLAHTDVVIFIKLIVKTAISNTHPQVGNPDSKTTVLSSIWPT